MFRKNQACIVQMIKSENKNRLGLFRGFVLMAIAGVAIITIAPRLPAYRTGMSAVEYGKQVALQFPVHRGE